MAQICKTRPGRQDGLWTPILFAFLAAFLAAFLVASGLALTTYLLVQGSWFLYPSDRWDCPQGSERYGRIEEGHLTYRCFALSDQRVNP